jgi:hypothetical protein
MKILPPDRKLAAWPLMAMMFGSASTRTTPSRFSASMPSMVAPFEVVLTPALAEPMPLPTVAPALPRTLPPATRRENFASRPGPPPMMPDTTRLVRPSADVNMRAKSRPNLSSMVLLTSAIFTSSITCCGRGHAQQVDHPLAVAVRARRRAPSSSWWRR